MSRSLDVATFLHLFNFAIIGYVIPHDYVLALCLGLLWEFLETRITSYPPTRTFLRTHFSDISHLWDETYQNKRNDIICNMIGYAFGSYLRTGDYTSRFL
jgi:hypothetical protein